MNDEQKNAEVQFPVDRDLQPHVESQRLDQWQAMQITTCRAAVAASNSADNCKHAVQEVAVEMQKLNNKLDTLEKKRLETEQNLQKPVTPISDVLLTPIYRQ